MKTLSILAILILGLSWSDVLRAQSFAAGNKHATAIGAVKINISLPDSFKNLMEDDGLKALALAGKAPANELLGVYADAEATQNAVKKGVMLPFSLRVAYMAKFRDRAITEADLASLRRAGESKTPAVLKPGSPEYKALVQRLSEGLSRATKEKVEYSVPEITQFGIVATAPDHFTSLMLMNLSFAYSDHTVTSPFLVATTMAMVRGRLVFAITYKQFQAVEDVEAIKKFSEDWFTQLRTDNP